MADLAASDLAKKLAEVRKAQADADAAEATAATAQLKARIGEPPQAPYSGAVMTGDGAGLAEINILARQALDDLAQKIVKGLKPHLTDRPTVFLSSGEKFPQFAYADSLDGRFKLINKAAAGALAISNKCLGVSEDIPGKNFLVEPVAVAGLVLNGVNSLLGFFKTDYTLGGIAVTLVDRVLVLAVAKRLKAGTKAIIVDGYYPPANSSEREKITEQTTSLSDKISVLRLRAAEHAKALAPLKAPAEVQSSSELAPEDADASSTDNALQEKALGACQAAVALFDKLEIDLFGDVSGVSYFERAAQEATMRSLLGEKSLFVSLKMDGAWGSHVSWKGLKAGFLGALPFKVSASTAASWAAFDFSSGTFLEADLCSARVPLTNVEDI